MAPLLRSLNLANPDIFFITCQLSSLLIEFFISIFKLHYYSNSGITSLFCSYNSAHVPHQLSNSLLELDMPIACCQLQLDFHQCSRNDTIFNYLVLVRDHCSQQYIRQDKLGQWASIGMPAVSEQIPIN